MNKLEFVNEVGNLANKFAFLLQNYTASHDGYDVKTEDEKPIIVGDISVSIQNGALATIGVNVGGVNSRHKIEISRYPNSSNDDWEIEDK